MWLPYADGKRKETSANTEWQHAGGVVLRELGDPRLRSCGAAPRQRGRENHNARCGSPSAASSFTRIYFAAYLSRVLIDGRKIRLLDVRMLVHNLVLSHSRA